MNTSKKARLVSLLLTGTMAFSLFTIAGATAENTGYTTETTKDGWIKVVNNGGSTLGYFAESGVTLLEDSGYAFKDLNKNGTLDPYEDWRLDAETRAADLASKMTTDQMAGLMMEEADWSAGTGEVTDALVAVIDQDIRLVSSSGAPSVTDRVAYVNKTQQLAEKSALGIPMNFDGEYGNALASDMPNNLGLGASFDPDLVERVAKAGSAEYRALGVTMMLSPQIDLVTEPRWKRFVNCFTEDPQLGSDMAASFVNGTQSTFDADNNDIGWGKDSVICILKHYPGDGSAESGRESHNFYGKYAVYPGDNLNTLLMPFEACLSLSGKTGSAAGVMPSYSIGIDADGEALGDEAVGSGFSSYKISELLRGDLGFTGFTLTDWGITDGDGTPEAGGRPWGVETLTVEERIKKIIEAGNDVVGYSYRTKQNMLDGIALYQEEYGDEATMQRLQLSANRILVNFFRVGLFDNPYLESSVSEGIVRNDEYAALAEEAQLKSIVMLKNSDNLIKAATDGDKPTVYIPMVEAKAQTGSNPTDAATSASDAPSYVLPLDIATASKYFNVVTDTVNGTDLVRKNADELKDCDYALVLVDGPTNVNEGYDSETSTYVPISLQYGEYTASSVYVRQQSIAGDEQTVTVNSTYGAQKVTASENRSYYGKSASISNYADLELILDTAKKVDKVIVAVNADRPMIFSEFEKDVDSILVHFGATDDALCKIVSGTVEPSGLLPCQMPANMDTVEAQQEDVPRDMECYVDAAGNTYDFTFGLNWSGVISDARVAKYNVEPVTK